MELFVTKNRFRYFQFLIDWQFATTEGIDQISIKPLEGGGVIHNVKQNFNHDNLITCLNVNIGNNRTFIGKTHVDTSLFLCFVHEL